MSIYGWQRYLSIEREFLEAQFYVSLTNTNNCVYSEFFTREVIILGSEIEGAFKELCKAIDGTVASNIGQYKETILKAYPGIVDIFIQNRESNVIEKPFTGWNEGPLSWWNVYTNTKHNVVDPEATLQVALIMLQAFELLLFVITATKGPVSMEYEEFPRLYLPPSSNGFMLTGNMKMIMTFDREKLISELRKEKIVNY